MPTNHKTADKRNTVAWKHLRRRVTREEPICWLRLPGCTYHATTADHVIPVSIAPELALDRANLRGACAHCNYTRNNKSVGEVAYLKLKHQRAATTPVDTHRHTPKRRTPTPTTPTPTTPADDWFN